MITTIKCLRVLSKTLCALAVALVVGAGINEIITGASVFRYPAYIWSITALLFADVGVSLLIDRLQKTAKKNE